MNSERPESFKVPVKTENRHSVNLVISTCADFTYDLQKYFELILFLIYLRTVYTVKYVYEYRQLYILIGYLLGALFFHFVFDLNYHMVYLL